MSTRPQELNKIISDLRQIIVGKVAMPTDQIEQITLFLFLKQLSKKHDELVRIGSKELIFTEAWERYHFDVLMRQSGEDLVKECREAVESLYKNPHIDPTVRKVFERSYLKILDPKVLSSFLIYLNDKFSDGLDLGDFYESLLPILGTQNELGQFRTPRHIIDFIVRVVDPGIGEKIADPACGTAGFLVAAFNYLKEKYTDKGRLTLNPEQIKQLYNETIYGWDMEPLMVKFSLANLYLHGLKVPNVSENDTLLNENLWQHTFDVIVANPPFITPTGGARRHSRFAITSNKTEVLFCEWMVHHLNFNGRMGIIVPEGIIFDASKGHQAIRKLFLDNGLWCVVSLPQAVFQPYSGVKTSIIFLDKTLKPENILFYKIENHGFSLNTNPSPIDKNDLPEAFKVITNFKKQLQDNKQEPINSLNCTTVPKAKILENSTTSLSNNIYIDRKHKENQAWEIVELGKLCSLQRGLSYSSAELGQINDGIPLYNLKSIKKNGGYSNDFKYFKGEIKEKHYVKSGDMLIALTDLTPTSEIIGSPKLITDDIKACYSADLAKIVIADDRLNLRYLYHLLKTSEYRKYIVSYSNGANVKHLRADGFLQYKIPLPPLNVQQQIVAELEGYQKIIDGARQVVNSWKPSFEIDPKWEEKSLGELLSFIGSGVTPKGGSSVYKTEGIMIIRSQNVLWGEFDFSNVAYITDEIDKTMQRSRVQKNDVLFNITGASIGRSALYTEDKRANVNQHVCILRSKQDVLYPNYLMNLMISPYIQDQVGINQSGVSREALNYEQIKQFKITLPTIDVQKKLVDKIEEEKKIVEANKRMIEIFKKKVESKVKSIWES